MRLFGSVSCASVLAFLLVAACVGEDVNTTSAPGGDAGDCTATEKSCAGRCVSRDDPAFGCGSVTCEPCTPAANSNAACENGACTSTCKGGFADCNVSPTDGCEVLTATSTTSCGKCGNACGAANTATPPKCSAGKCEFSCAAGFGHCGSDDATGCETPLGSDPLNCGACGHSCLGGACVGGKCQPFQVASASSPRGVAVDATTVYFTSSSLNYIQRTGHDGKCNPAAPCPQQFVGSPDSLPQYRGPAAIITDGSFVWFMGEAISSIGRRAVSGGPINNWGPAASSGTGNIVLANNKIFWTNDFSNAADPAPHVLMSDLDGSNVKVVATYDVPVTTFRGIGGITADETSIYWASTNSAVFTRAFADMGTPCSETVGAGNCKRIGGTGVDVAVDANYVYWTNRDGGTVEKAPKAGGSSSYVASGQTGILGIAVMDNFVYWGTPGAIRRAPQVAATCAGAACELVANVEAPDGIVAAADGLYWANNISAGGVYRLAK